jgi:hypothetical protein
LEPWLAVALAAQETWNGEQHTPSSTANNDYQVNSSPVLYHESKASDEKENGILHASSLILDTMSHKKVQLV